MQWNNRLSAGFSSNSKTWLPIGDDFKTRNVQKERMTEKSFLNLYRKLIHLRRDSPTLKYGKLKIIDAKNPDVLAYIRYHDDDIFMTVINFSNQKSKCQIDYQLSKLIVSSDPNSKISLNTDAAFELQPYEGALFLAKSDHT